MALVIAEDFESGLGAWTLNGVPTTAAAAAHTGSAGMVIDTTGGAATQYIQQNLAGGTRVFTARLYFALVTGLGTTQNLLTCANVSGQLKLIVTAGGALRTQIASGATQTSSVLTLGQFYRVDLRFTSSGATATIDWQIDGVAQTQATNVQAAADQTQLRIGMLGSTTAKFYVDTLVTGNAAGDYPFGANPVSASAGVASATGQTFAVASSELAALAGNAAATGAVGTVSAKDSVNAGAIAVTGAAGAPKTSVAPSPAVVSGTGAAGTPSPTLAVPIGNAAASGAAYAATTAATSNTSLTIYMG